MDTLHFLSEKPWGTFRANSKQRSEKVRDLIDELHHEAVEEPDRARIKGRVVEEVYYFFPYFLKQHSLPKELFDEAMQNMVLHTYSAIDRFDPSWGTPFSVYLKKYLKAAISDAKQESKTIKTPISVRQKTLDQLEKEANEAEELDQALRAHSRYAELTPTLTHPDEEAESNSDQFYEKCEEEFYGKESPEKCMMQQELTDILEYVLSSESSELTEKEKVVLKHRYGVFNIEKLTLEEVAHLFQRYGWNASKEWIFQLQKRSLSKVHQMYKEWNLIENSDIV